MTAVVFFSIGDLLAKYLTRFYPIGLIVSGSFYLPLAVHRRGARAKATDGSDTHEASCDSMSARIAAAHGIRLFRKCG